MKNLLLIVILYSANGWVVSWEAHEDNVAVVVVTECDNPAFVAYNRQDVDAKQNRTTFRRHRVPDGAKCFVTAMLMRNTDVSPEGYAAEVAYTSQEGP